MKKIKTPYSPVKGGVTAAKGFSAWGLAAGIKKSGLDDVGLLFSKSPCSASGVYTTNTVRAACIGWNSRVLPSDKIHAVVCNSGNANACTGAQGDSDVRESAATAGRLLGAVPQSVCIASTGVIGEFLPVDKLRDGIRGCASKLSPKGGHRFARAIMTTDTVPKECAVQVRLARGEVTIGGCAKGAGMICPNMATMLCFITSDARIKASQLKKILAHIVDRTFNNLTVDGDMSTNDMVLMLANGESGIAIESPQDIAAFSDALFGVCNGLCARIAADGEGATKRVEIIVRGGKTYSDCKAAAKSVANSNLVKTALFGNDPNWGRILCAIGYSGARISPDKINVRLCGVPVFQSLRPTPFDKDRMRKAMAKKIVTIEADLGFGTKHSAIAHTCDFSYDYVKINAEYHT